MGIRTVAVFSEADRESLHVQLADEAYCIGPASPMGSYLNVINIVSIATLTGCDAVHPGYGFLAENADFAELCADCNVAFIGPDADAMNKMGAKDVARKTMADAGIPVVPGSDGLVRDWNEAAEVAENIGFPVLIKAAAGGEEREYGLPAIRLNWKTVSALRGRKPLRHSAIPGLPGEVR